MTALENANPLVYSILEDRSLTQDDTNNEIVDEIDDREVFDILLCMQLVILPRVRVGHFPEIWGKKVGIASMLIELHVTNLVLDSTHKT